APIVGLFLLAEDAESLKCFNGYTFVRGQNVGTTFETCTRKNDYCYNVTADVNIISKVKMAGCASLKCILSKNKCIKHKVDGKKVKLCCCNGYDLCNGNEAAKFSLDLLPLVVIVILFAFSKNVLPVNVVI
uniref:Activin_recp domain-containing protein n=1 Tax=Parascaris univalens TaxID=6257 RepID=A0A915BQA6_PARUN